MKAFRFLATRQLIIWIIWFFGSISLINGQSLKKEIESLEKDFKSFQYNLVIEKGKFLLSDRFTTKSDSLEIFKYMLSSAYALNDTTLARDIIEDILKTDPKFSLNPLETSPKIIEFFNFIKADLQQTESADTLNSVPKDFKIRKEPTHIRAFSTLASVIVPGTGHLLQKNKSKGLLFTSISTVLIGSAIYSSLKVADDHDKYLRARDDADYDKLYNRYNSSYQQRSVIFIIYGIWNLYTLYDLQKASLFSMTLNKNLEKVSFGIHIHW